jgi:hypothetical protein
VEVLAAEDDAEAAVSEPELLLGLVPADGSDAGLGAAAGVDVAGAVPSGEVEQHDFP